MNGSQSLVEEYSDGKAIASSPADVERLYLRHHLLLCACLIKALPIAMYDCITQLERMSPTMVTGNALKIMMPMDKSRSGRRLFHYIRFGSCRHMPRLIQIFWRNWRRPLLPLHYIRLLGLRLSRHALAMLLAHDVANLSCAGREVDRFQKDRALVYAGLPWPAVCRLCTCSAVMPTLILGAVHFGVDLVVFHFFIFVVVIIVFIIIVLVHLLGSFGVVDSLAASA